MDNISLISILPIPFGDDNLDVMKTVLLTPSINYVEK